MTVYNVNLGIGWASSGVEYAQAYRNKIFKKLDIPAKFIFSDLILNTNIENLTRNLGFSDQDIIWLYNFFTDVKIAPTSYKLSKLEQNLKLDNYTKTIENNQVFFTYNHMQIIVRLNNLHEQTIDEVSYLINKKLVKRDFYSYVKYAREYYSDNQVIMREFYNEDSSIAYTQHLNGQNELFEFPDQRIFYSKNELYLEMIKRLHLSKNDFVIMDREDEHKDLLNGQLLFRYHNPAKLLVVVHAEHYDHAFANPNEILWNNFYEYQFTHSNEVASYIVATPTQKDILAKQFKKYYHITPRIDCIPVGHMPNSIRSQHRKPFSLITASRLAPEKHVDWAIKAVILAHKSQPEITFDIYGQGNSAPLEKIIKDAHAESYIHLMGQQDLTNIYQNYEAYLSASTSEGFGLSLMEAVNSGLAMVGFNVPYGNTTFIKNAQNGYLVNYNSNWNEADKIQMLARAIVKLFDKDLNQYHDYSYKIAAGYLTDNVAKKWQKMLGDLRND